MKDKASFLIITFTVFLIVAKVTHQTDLSWALIFAPIWFPVAFVLAAFLLTAIIVLIRELIAFIVYLME